MSEQLVTMDDWRITAFAKEFPETTHAAACTLRDMLEDAERKGRETAIDGLGEQLDRRIEQAVQKRTDALENETMKLHWLLDAARNLASSWAVYQKARERVAEERGANGDAGP